MKEINAVLFDFGGTLYDFYPSNNEVWASIINQFGREIHPDDPSLIKAISHQTIEFEKLVEDYHAGKRGKIVAADWTRLNRLTLSTIGITDPEAVTAVQQAFNDRYGHFKIFPDSQSTLFALKNAGLRLGLISNTAPDLLASRREHLREHGILDVFDSIVLASETGVSKPDKRIFELTLKQMNITDPATAWYVGDSFVMDVKGSRNAGLVPVLFDPFGMRKTDCLRIRSLSELLELVRDRSI